MALLTLAELPALPLHTAGKYVAAAYIVLFVLVLVYVAIMAIRLTRVERNLGELLALSERAAEEPAAEPAAPGSEAESDRAPRESTLA
jgi:hypothetical protein